MSRYYCKCEEPNLNKWIDGDICCTCGWKIKRTMKHKRMFETELGYFELRDGSQHYVNWYWCDDGHWFEDIGDDGVKTYHVSDVRLCREEMLADYVKYARKLRRKSV